MAYDNMRDQRHRFVIVVSLMVLDVGLAMNCIYRAKVHMKMIDKPCLCAYYAGPMPSFFGGDIG